MTAVNLFTDRVPLSRDGLILPTLLMIMPQFVGPFASAYRLSNQVMRNSAAMRVHRRSSPNNVRRIIGSIPPGADDSTHSGTGDTLWADVIVPKRRRDNRRWEKRTEKRQFCVNQQEVVDSPVQSATRVKAGSECRTEAKEAMYDNLVSLSGQLRHHDELYYTPHKSPEITDEQYDKLAAEEAGICTRYPELLLRLEQDTGLGPRATRFGGRVGTIINENANSDIGLGDHISTNMRELGTDTPRNRSAKRMHSERMLSLESVNTKDDAQKWFERIRKQLVKGQFENTEIFTSGDFTILAQPKLDGLSLNLRYEASRRGYEKAHKDQLFWEYRLAWSATRGDGSRGEDVSEAVQQISDTYVPKYFETTLSSWGLKDAESMPEFIEIRGEVILPRKAFEKIKQSKFHDDEFSGADAHDGETPQLAIKKAPSAYFANPRNAASGILQRSRNLSSDESRLLCSELAFFAYDVVSSSTAFDVCQDSTLQTCLEDAGFQWPKPDITCSASLTSSKKNAENDPRSNEFGSLSKFYSDLIANRSKLEFEIDGAVYKLDNKNYRKLCGSSSRAPRWAVAHKFPPMCAATRIVGLDIQVGRTGALTPVAILEPVTIGGTTVSRASLHNFSYAARVLVDGNGHRKNSIARSTHPAVERGTLLLVAKAGDVIPKIIGLSCDVTTAATIDATSSSAGWISLLPPDECPSCGSRTVFEKVKSSSDISSVELYVDSSDNDEPEPEISGRVLRCSGPALCCEARAVGMLALAFSRPALNISGLSKTRIAQLRRAGLLNRASDIFRFVQNSTSLSGGRIRANELLERVSGIPGWGEKSARNLVDSVAQVAMEGVSLERFIYSLGIRHLGLYSSRIIANHFGSARSFLDELEVASRGIASAFEGLHNDGSENRISGIGPVLVASLIDFAKESSLVEAAADLACAVRVVNDQEKAASSTAQSKKPFSGLKVVFTGSLPNFRRTDAKKIAVIMGATSTPDIVTESTNLVVEGNNGGKKLLKARMLGIRVMTAEEFLRLADAFR